MKVFLLIIKCFYLLLPKFFRDQYSDSIHWYYGLLIKIKNKIYDDSIRHKNNDVETLKVNLLNSIGELNCNSELLFSSTNRTSFINAPKICIDNQNYFKSKLHNHVPDINIYKLHNVKVVGHTDAVLSGDNFTHLELTFMEDFHDLKRPEVFSKNNDNSYNIAVNYQERDKYTKKYITLLKEHSINYFHWTTEAIPRIVMILDLLKKQVNGLDLNEYTVLVDDGLPKQCIDMLKILIGKEINIIFLKKGESFFCEELIYCTPLWHSLDNTTGLPNPKKEFFVDKYALEIVREAILSSFSKSNRNTSDFKKVYLQRLNNKLRPITNLNEVELLLFKSGFEFIDVGSLDFFEQIELFQNADVVIGASGASFTNLLFMHKDSKAINFYPSASATNYYVFQPLADVSGVDLIHFLTTPTNGEVSVHAEASIDLKNLELFLKEI